MDYSPGRLLVLSPVATLSEAYVSRIRDLRTDVSMDIVTCPGAPDTIESIADAERAVQFACDALRSAVTPDTRAIIVNCMADPGIMQLQQIVALPLFPSFRTCLEYISRRTNRISVVTLNDSSCEVLRQLSRRYDMEEVLVSIRGFGGHVADCERPSETLLRAIAEQINRAVVDDEAESVIFGCTSLLGIAEKVRALLPEALRSIDLVEPLQVIVHLATELCTSTVEVRT